MHGFAVPTGRPPSAAAPALPSSSRCTRTSPPSPTPPRDSTGALRSASLAPTSRPSPRTTRCSLRGSPAPSRPPPRRSSSAAPAPPPPPPQRCRHRRALALPRPGEACWGPPPTGGPCGRPAAACCTACGWTRRTGGRGSAAASSRGAPRMWSLSTRTHSRGTSGTRCVRALGAVLLAPPHPAPPLPVMPAGR